MATQSPIDDDPDLEAFLHIVHISDMHCKAAGAKVDIAAEQKVRWLIRLLERGGRRAQAASLRQRWESGLAGHDPNAHDQMCDFLDQFARHRAFSGIETWLVDTGDLSAMGDAGSIRTAMDWIEEYAAILGARETLVLHGNHDAWPCRFPLWASQAEIDAQQQALRELIKKTWPHMEISAAIPNSPAHVKLNGINSTTGDRLANTLARGIVDTDPPWPCEDAALQLERLAERTTKQFSDTHGVRDFRILAVHHPVHYPEPRPFGQMTMKNARHVAAELAAFTSHERGFLAHLLLSGHTHETYPAMGELPPTSTGQQYKPLYEGQLQLIAGSLSQLPRFADMKRYRSTIGDAYVPQQCQILTFFSSPRSARQQRLWMERRIVGRASAGPYKFMRAADRRGSVETVVWQY
jgi:hypothetical protein